MKKDNKLEDQVLSGRGSGTKSRQMFKDTLSRALLADDGKKLRMLCDQLLDIALTGSLPLNERLGYIKLIIERVEGRPAQSIELSDGGAELPSAGQFKIVKVEPTKDD